MIKYTIALAILLIQSPTHAMDMCDTAGGYDDFEQITNQMTAPNVHARFELDNSCNFDVLTTTYTTSNKSLQDFVKQITDPAVNKASAPSNVKSYSVKNNGDGTFEQIVTASKSIASATIVNTCRYTTNTADKVVYECNLKDGDGVLKNNKTVITCTNHTSSIKKCTFQTKGLAIKQYFKGPCTLAAGGAAETVNGVFRLMEYVSFGKVDEKKWTEPGAKFYKAISDYDVKPSRNFVYSQQIQ